MNELIFENKMHELISKTTNLQSKTSNKEEQLSYKRLLSILIKIKYSNRQDFKGLLSRYIIDSYVGDWALSEELINFENTF